MNQSIKMCLASSFAVSGGLVAIGILEQFDTPLSKTTCFNGYTDCSNELRQHGVNRASKDASNNIPYMLAGITMITIMYVILHYNKVFKKMEIDR